MTLERALEDLILAAAGLSPVWLYGALFLSAYIENVFPPIPGDTVTVFGAFLVGRTGLHFMGVYVSTTLGSVAGFMTLYALGRRVHADFFLRKNYRFFPASTFLKTRAWFERRGLWLVLLNRFLGGIRSMISLVAGVYRLPALRVAVLALVSCTVWNGLLIWAGYLLGSNWRAIEAVLREYSRALLIVTVLAVAAWIVRNRRRRA